ncbi:xanthine dehydrogenase molybdopterin binding subunit [Piscinibacter koreensis]|uniref:Xanthine dehydrogenase molybdopterin binding subunit n=1 Tax=Piscinibacter koreensis TaxID=2742824 RepID=A0A7Y6NPC3_9BURK|nr:xanthine dehydrogenase molybdopterin binding subunit [Schlegelella koreensis]NUZ06898.1 xanthine dehydrogenase molybdopterin binding subunit [Schlegelella koreensis]
MPGVPAFGDPAADAARRAGGARVGVARPHESAHLHVAGAAPYIDDLPELAGTLQAALGLSPVAHGTLRAFDTARIAALPGVVAVLTARDIPGVNDCGPVLHDDPILVEREISHVGQPVFVVIADTRDAARRAAAEAPRVLTIDALPPTIEPLDAHRDEAYVLPPMHLRRGDARRAIDAAPHRLADTFAVGGQEQFYLEGQISVAIPKEDGGIFVHCSTQHPSEMQHVVAHALGIASHRVQVECRRMGGGFGGKESQSALFACVAAVAAQRLGRPVKLRVDRDDDFLITGRRHCFRYEYEVGYDDEGRVLGAELTMVSRAGFSADLSGPVMTRAICHFDNAYFLPAVAVHGYSAKTHTQSNTAFRGFGGPQGAIAIENILDSIARRLGKDPLDVRRVNFYAERAEATPHAATNAAPAEPHDRFGADPLAARNVTPYGQVVDDNVIHALVAELEASSDYRARRTEVDAFNAASPVLKRGLALTPVKFGISFNLVHLNQAGALVHVYRDGSVLVNHGGTEMGQGLNTKVAQVVAHELGVDFDAVRVTPTDTHKVANTSATAASTGSDLNGKAAQAAAAEIRTRLAAVAAERLGCEPQALRFANGRVTPAPGAAVRPAASNGPTADRERAPAPAGPAGAEPDDAPPGFTFRELVEFAYLARVQLWSDGFYATPGLHWDAQAMQGRPFFYFAYGAAVSEVVVDTLTGESKVLRADVLHDAGRSLNPAVDLGQVEGGFIQGMGWLTSEELVWHAADGSPKAGRLMTHAPSTYKIPTANDCPPIFDVRLFDAGNAADTIHRSKATGEPPLLLAFSVFFAIRDAVSAAGNHRVDPPLTAPATPEAILRAITAVQAGR